MPSTQTVPVTSTRAVEVTGPDGVAVTVQNLGPDSCYYATASTVSSGVNDGTVASGATIGFLPSKYFVSAGTSRLVVSIGDLRPAITQVAELKRAASLPAGAIDATLPRGVSNSQATALAATGRLVMVGWVMIPAGRPVTSMSLLLGSTLTVSPTNQWFTLVRVSDLAVLAKTVDATTTVAPVNAVQTLALSVTYTPAVDTLAYFGVVYAAATLPTVTGFGPGAAGAVEMQLAPIAVGWSTTGLTVPSSLGVTAGAVSAVGQLGFGYIS